MRTVRRSAAVAAAAVLAFAGAFTIAVPAAHADDVNFQFQAAAQAPVAQITEDEPSASFHPEGEGEYTYAEADLSSAGAHAFASPFWPGAAGGNAGTLVQVLGGPDAASVLNDPVRAEAGSGTGADEPSCCPAGSGTQMTASVKSPGPAAAVRTTGNTLGAVGAFGDSSASASAGRSGNTVTVTASSIASDVNIGDVVKIGSVTSSATMTGGAGGGQPVTKSSTVFNGFTIAGQSAYVDGGGVHVGTPGDPATGPETDLVNQALAGAGMTIGFTAPQKIGLAGTEYYYAASVLVFWKPPNNSSNNTFTVSLGGAAVALSVTPGVGGLVTTDTGAASAIGAAPGGAPASPPPPAASVALPTTDAGQTVSAPAPAVPTGSPVRAAGSGARAGTGGGSRARALPVDLAVYHPSGVGPLWVALFLLAAIAAAVFGRRLPALLAAGAKPACELDRRRHATRSGS